MTPCDEPQQSGGSMGAQLPLDECLRPAGLGEPDEAVVALHIVEVGAVHLPGEPESAVEADHELKGKPGLQPQVHAPKLAVLEIKTVMQAAALAEVQMEPGGLGVMADLIREARLEDREDADQAVVDPVAFGEPAGAVLLAPDARLEVAQRTAATLGESGRGRAHAVGQAADEAGEVLQSHASRAQIAEHERRLIQVAEAAPQAEPIVAGDYARDIRAVRCQKPPQSRAAMRRDFWVHPRSLPPRISLRHGFEGCFSESSARSSVVSVSQSQSLWLRRQPR